MFGYRRVLIAGRHLIGRSCPFTRSEWRRPVHSSRPLGRHDPPQEVTSLEEKSGVDKDFTPQQRDVILRLLNTASESQLDCVRELQGKKSAGIVRYREQNGPFPDLDTLRRVQNFQPTFIHRLCLSMLSLMDRTDRTVLAKFLKPDIPVYRLQEAESIVSIVFGLRKLAWAHVDRSLTVREWQQEECFHLVKGKHLPEVYLETISSVVSQLPQADYYILEKPAVSSSQNTSLFPVVLHLRTVEAMLFCLLNPQIVAEQEQRVFSMNRSTVGKHFEIMVGEARTSGVEVVQRLIAEASIAPKPRVTFPSELLRQYHQKLQPRGQNRAEEMCDALLQALTCYELVLI
ncbi:transcription elongation factor, mitochondrial [Rana temporaria]|uniref:transcription elongation factor, mitochondrial n=1 Tax=Rana temporaria TaxID=8407 RepID=UPI001AAD7402|nr:transcription elongation factor, mitochondrial [Rana temporaria]